MTRHNMIADRSVVRNQGEDTVVEPAGLASFFTIFFTSAMVVLLGALYALLFAFSRIKGMPKLMPLAYIAYAGLLTSALFLAHATHMFNSLLWAAIVMFLLVGYWLAPHAIWHLCVGTHAAEHERQDAGTKSV